MLLVEDLLLLLLDDETGIPAGAGTLYYPLGGAVLVELALLGRVEHADGKVIAVGEGALPDPILQEAWDKAAAKPRRAQTLIIEVGTRLWDPLIERLIEKGQIRRETKRLLRVFKTTRLPSADPAYEQGLRDKVRAVLVDGAEPDPRTAAVIALLSASGSLPAVRPPIAWSSEVIKRAKRLEEGHWGAAEVNTAVITAAAAIAVASATTAATVAITTSN
ncbi:hypothetical protein FB565_009062 [Actinoplanes lutulentus]|uniref:Golgi phosphoprotein 3 GPP34 n=1 Tax=Actinoplanes lutulentus TaxID=1287878 RepID=A0A327Z212_9ACTN|nr:GPP34 family phosphoprotein [Actinoplanes lutulentus]MBB2949257.1 hypothetical protein [Actinoplanes lutulentus]RAK28778.1 Golgi phosphoprotein 3 GPP34 [Actinoplanes lutulentus]